MCAIKIDGKIVSSKTKKTAETIKTVVSKVGKEVRWIEKGTLDLREGNITKEFDTQFEVNGLNRDKYKNPNKDYKIILVDKNKIQYG